jgi:hypothetical protein
MPRVEQVIGLIGWQVFDAERGRQAADYQGRSQVIFDSCSRGSVMSPRIDLVGWLAVDQ